MAERFKLIPAVYLILEKSGKYLFLRRFNTGYMDGLLGLPSGHVEQNEDLLTAIIRESKEEIDINLIANDLELVHTSIRYIDGANDRIDFYFKAKNWTGKIINMEPTKCSELSWQKIENKEIIPYLKDILIKIEQGEVYSSIGFK